MNTDALTDPSLPEPAQATLAFWFGRPGDADYCEPRDMWFRKNDALDLEMKRRFGPLIEQALQGDLQAWDARPGGALARILLLDQFTRNVFRGTPRAFAGDALALAAARAMVAAGTDQALPPHPRGFVYLPFEHAEDLQAQHEAVRLFERLAAQAPQTDSMLDYAHRHRVIIERFGRFPHRNAILDRPSTEAERAFLREPGSSF